MYKEHKVHEVKKPQESYTCHHCFVCFKDRDKLAKHDKVCKDKKINVHFVHAVIKYVAHNN